MIQSTVGVYKDCTWLDWASCSCATFGSDDDGDYSCDGDSREEMMKNILRIMTVMSTVAVILTTTIMIMTMAMITLKASSTGSQSSKLNPFLLPCLGRGCDTREPPRLRGC